MKNKQHNFTARSAQSGDSCTLQFSYFALKTQLIKLQVDTEKHFGLINLWHWHIAPPVLKGLKVLKKNCFQYVIECSVKEEITLNMLNQSS